MANALIVKITKSLLNFSVNPCFTSIIGGLCANRDYFAKSLIGSYPKLVAPDGFAQRPRHFETIKRNYRPSLGLHPKGYRVIALDLRGNGDSDKPQDDDAYSQDAEVLDIMFLLLHLRLSKYMAVGYSRGSIILARLMTKDRRLTKAVLGGMGIDFTNPKWHRRIMFTNAFEGKTTEETQGAVDYAKSINADLRSLYLQQKHQPVTSISQLNQIKIKVLVIAGDSDLDNGNPVELSQNIPKSKLKIVPGDHNITYKSADFSDAVLSFL